jgi:plastocyanin
MKNNTTKLIIAIVAVAIVAVGVVMLFGKSAKEEPAPSNNENTAAATTITYTNDGFNPASVTVAAGTTIKFVNLSSEEAEPASDPHPEHTNNPELNAGDIPAGGSATVTAETPGTWGIHNHYKKDHKATITVQ